MITNLPISNWSVRSLIILCVPHPNMEPLVPVFLQRFSSHIYSHRTPGIRPPDFWLVSDLYLQSHSHPWFVKPDRTRHFCRGSLWSNLQNWKTWNTWHWCLLEVKESFQVVKIFPFFGGSDHSLKFEFQSTELRQGKREREKESVSILEPVCVENLYLQSTHSFLFVDWISSNLAWEKRISAGSSDSFSKLLMWSSPSARGFHLKKTNKQSYIKVNCLKADMSGSVGTGRTVLHTYWYKLFLSVSSFFRCSINRGCSSSKIFMAEKWKESYGS